MSGVDNRVVKLTFDNAAFEKGIQTTLTSLDKLKSALSFEGAKNGFADISAAAGKLDMQTISDGIEGVSKKFIALSTVAITALAGIASKAIDVGTTLVKSLSLDNVIAGFQEYQTNLQSIQTILANTSAKGGNLQTVNAALDQLNAYSDKTIYNFGEMARNIGTFTAAGVDLDKSVSSIKGIANIAALSGSSSEQASTAMYQLSQAIAAGSVKLMDWNSVVNAGMGGEVFQKALFNTGKQMGKIKDVPMGQTFEQWTKAGNTFRGSLEQGWLTADVLTSTLSQFTGDMTDAQLAAQGFTKEQIANIQQMAKVATEAATQIKTFGQLTGTIKEAIGSGWSESFRLIIGNFEEAKSLFTAIGQVTGNMVQKSADARNKVLGGWRMLGGRDVLLKGIAEALNGLWTIVKPIKDAFREIFPPATAQTLMSLTQAFENFASKIAISGSTANNIKTIFKGFFSIFKIGIDVVKGIIGVFTNLVGSIGSGAGGLLDWIAGIAGFISSATTMQKIGQGITSFFSGITDAIKTAIGWIGNITSKIGELFGKGASAVGSGTSVAVDALGARLEHLQTIGEKIGAFFDWFNSKLAALGRGIWNVIKTIGDMFQQLMQRIADVMTPGDFSNVLDGLEVGLLGGIVVLLRKFLKNGLKLDFTGGLFDGIKSALEQLTGVLKAMQTKIKADALMRIAEAIAVLTASLVVLSLIDSVALVRALSAMAVGFGELVGAMALLNQMASGMDAGKLAALSAGLIILSGAMLVLSLAVKILSTMSWGELATGLLATAGLLTMLVLVAKNLEGSTGSLIKAGIGMVGISIGIWALSMAVKSFGSMAWGEIIKGFTGVAIGLVLLSAVVNTLPEDMTSKGLGLLLISLAMSKLSDAVKAFAGMKFGDIVKGFIGVAAGLLLIGAAMNLMPPEMIVMAAGILLVSIAIGVMADAVKKMGSMDIGTMAKGILGIGAALLVLAIGVTAMDGAMAGAVALGVVTLALMGLVKVVEAFGKIGIGTLLSGLLGMAAAIAVLAVLANVISPLVPALLALGVALAVVGAAFALFGVGIKFVGEGFAILSKAGKAGLDNFISILQRLITLIPDVVAALVVGLIEGFQQIVDQAPKLIKGVEKILSMLLDAIIHLAPKVADALVTIILEAIGALEKIIPKVVELGVKIILALLTGIRDNIYNIVTVGLEIIQQLAKAIIDNIDVVVSTATQILVAFITAVANNVQMIIDAGVSILVNFILGITRDVVKIVGAVTVLITSFITAIANMYTQIAQAGTDALVQFLGGITGDIKKIADAVGTLIVTFISEMGKKATDIAKAGTDALVSFLGGLADDVTKITDAVGRLIMRFFKALGDMATQIADAGTAVAIQLLSGLEKNVRAISFAAVHFVLTLMSEMGKATVQFAQGAFAILIGTLNALADVIRTNGPQINAAAKNLVSAIVDGIVAAFGLSDMFNKLKKGIENLLGGVWDAAMKFIGAKSPSKEYKKLGGYIVDGLAIGLQNSKNAEDGATSMVANVQSAFNDAMKKAQMNAVDIAVTQPVIAPVLDLSNVESEAQRLSGLLQPSPITVDTSFQQANLLSHTTDVKPTETPPPPPPQPAEVTFEQNIYSPTALSTNDIYRATRSQIAQAKEELKIP